MDYLNDYICRIYFSGEGLEGKENTIRVSYRCGDYQELLGWLSLNIKSDERYEIFRKVNA